VVSDSAASTGVPGPSNEAEPYRVIREGGEAAVEPSDLGLKDEDLLELLRLLILVRRADLEATALQRQGELAVYPPLIGQEAAQVGSAFAVARDDYLFPSYRELGVAVVRGVDLVEYLHFYRATWHGGTYDPNEMKFGMVSVPVGSQALHAVGYAMGRKMDGASDIAVAYFGDGATSEGDLHEAWNFAAVFRAPVVFFCQNNQWAISVPLSQQTVAPIWRKAGAYGFPGVLVDGNDVLAVYQVTKEAAERARSDGTPTLIEALTYRLGPHSTADDAGRYQPKEQVEEWRARDPVERYARFLQARGLADEEQVKGFHEDAKRAMATMREGVVGSGPRPVEELFEWVFEGELPEHLRRQRDEVLGAAGEGNAGA
jgi:2-oxoisovalerate dehydrogenase E1 component alpha subunit